MSLLASYRSEKRGSAIQQCSVYFDLSSNSSLGRFMTQAVQHTSITGTERAEWSMVAGITLLMHEGQG